MTTVAGITGWFFAGCANLVAALALWDWIDSKIKVSGDPKAGLGMVLMGIPALVCMLFMVVLGFSNWWMYVLPGIVGARFFWAMFFNE